jgi:hypothetical protein
MHKLLNLYLVSIPSRPSWLPTWLPRGTETHQALQGSFLGLHINLIQGLQQIARSFVDILGLPSGKHTKKILNMAIYSGFNDLPIKNGAFPKLC